MGGLAPHVQAAIAAAMQPRMAGGRRVGARPDPPRGQSVGLQAKPATRILTPSPPFSWHATLRANAVQLAQAQEEPEIEQHVATAYFVGSEKKLDTAHGYSGGGKTLKQVLATQLGLD